MTIKETDNAREAINRLNAVRDDEAAKELVKELGGYGKKITLSDGSVIKGGENIWWFSGIEYRITDGVESWTWVADDGQRLSKKYFREIARDYANTYDYADETTEADFSVCEIRDGENEPVARFAFNKKGKFEWDTSRRFRIY